MMKACVFVCVCMHACVRERVTKWLEHQPGNQKVPGLMPDYTGLVLFPYVRSFTHITPIYTWGPSCLVSTGEAAHPAVTSMVPGVN